MSQVLRERDRKVATAIALVRASWGDPTVLSALDEVTDMIGYELGKDDPRFDLGAFVTIAERGS